ncbi:MAG: hypothetical protein WCY93_11105 [Anaerolineaceae bacterium]
MSALIEKLLKNSTIKETALINESKVYGKKDIIQTDIPMLNVALSGSLDGGLTAGLLCVSGPSKHFKSAFALVMAAAYQRKYPDGIVLFYDSEFGSPPEYFANFGLDMDRVVHTPVVNIEKLKFDITKQLNELKRGDNVCIVVDSIGNLASVKEADDALDGKSVADMSRAKQLKSVFRIATPHLSLKNIPMIIINHVYMEQGMYPRAIISGGTGLYYSSNDIWIVGRQQEKEGAEVSGYNFVINIEKSRYVKEKSKIPINVTFKGGINKNSGLFDLALASGFIVKPKMGWYNKVDQETGEISQKSYRQGDLVRDKEYWKEVLDHPKFKSFVEDKYKLKAPVVSDDEIPDDMEDELDADD